MSGDLFVVVSTLAKLVVVFAILLGIAPLLIWVERRQSAMIQDRIGPTRAGVKLFGREIRLFGLLHPVADAVKFFFKEDFIPPNADKLLHSLAPLIAVFPAFATFAVVPFGDVLHLDYLWDTLTPDTMAQMAPRHELVERGSSVALQVATLNVGVLYVFGIAGTGILGAAIAGASSDNKYSLLGGLRAASQMVSYEVALVLSIVGAFLVYGSVRLEDMVAWQKGHVWGIFVQPVGFLLFLTAAIAEQKRVPFDLPEGESEIVGGYFTEYSGMKFGLFFTGEFIEVIVHAALIATLFFGGYHLPFLDAGGFVIGGWRLGLPHLVVVLLQLVTFVAKIGFFIWFQMMLRWSLPRFRYDQVMKLGWKVLLPIALVNLLVTGIIVLAIDKVQ
ncbi:MAG: NADH-quinone oxidoreductase subunit NuoH [Deltaproteobacteria bacterium]|nr:NADH-quinone oxidoreductase subunit NuoH [Deltaproteobacteria bacterium]